MSEGLQIDTSEIEDLLKKFPQFQDIILDEMTGAIYGSLSVFEEQVKGRAPVGVTGNLRNSFLQSVQGRGVSLEGQLATSIAYGWAVERGRPPGPFPTSEIDSLELWVQRVLGISDGSRSVAYAIAASIAVRGTQAYRRGGAKMVAEGFAAGQGPALKIWEQVVPRSIARIEAKIRQ